MERRIYNTLMTSDVAWQSCHSATGAVEEWELPTPREALRENMSLPESNVAGV